MGFQFIMTEGNVGYSKEHPNVYLEAAQRLGSDEKNTIVFEDALYAIKTAKNAGFKTIAVKEKHFINDEKEIKTIADLTIEDFNELMTLIKINLFNI